MAAYKTLFVRTTAGRSNYIDWTVAVEFKAPGVEHPAWNDKSKVSIEAINIGSPVPKSAKANTDIEILSQIVKTAEVETVPTLGVVEYLLYFCPDRQTTQRLAEI